MDYKDVLAKIIARNRILIFGDFLLANGIHTQYYLDFGIIANTPGVVGAISEILSDFIAEKGLDGKFNKIVGIMNKGVLLIPPLAISMKKPFALFARYENNVAIGSINSNDNILIVDDLISSGRTISRVARLLKNIYRSKVRYAVVLVDRMEGGVERVREVGVKVLPLIKVTQLADKLYTMGVIGNEERDIIYSEAKRR